MFHCESNTSCSSSSSQSTCQESTKEDRCPLVYCKKVSRGPRGPRGHKGKRGCQGPPGKDANRDESSGSFYTYAQPSDVPTPTVAPGDPVLFDQQHVPIHGSAFTYVLGSGSFNFQQSGSYRVSFGVAQNQHNASVVLQLNSSQVAGTQTFVNDAYSLDSADYIISVTAPSTLQLVNNSTGPFTLASFPGNISAFLNIQKLSNY